MFRMYLRSVLLAILSAIVGLSAAPAVADNACASDRLPDVDEIYPTADTLPDNLLRFYVYFSEPMRREAVLEHVTLRSSASGVAVEGVFFQSRYDLWSTDGLRLTLLLDPGRVKSGLDSSENLGRAFTIGDQYRLEIDRSIRAANGCTLGQDVFKAFTVERSDVDIPDMAQWRIDAPRAHTKEPLTIALNGPYDHVSLAFRVRVKTGGGQPVAGSIDLASGETEWRFTPTAPWTDSQYVIRVHPALEDIAGNRLTGLFDDPTGESRINQSQSNAYELPFWPAK